MINQPVFGTEMVLLTFIVLIIQFVFVLIHFGVIISRPFSKSNWRFLLLILLFINYSISSGLLPDENIKYFSLFVQNILAFGSGIFLAIYYYYFLVKEIEIEQRKFFNVKILLLSLIISFGTLYITTYILYKDFNLARNIFIVAPVIIALYFCYNTILEVKKLSSKSSVKSSYKCLNFAGKLGITFMATMPIIVAIGDYQLINIGLVNISFILIVISYYTLILLQAKNERDLNANFKDEQSLEYYNLTPRELEVASFILKGEKYIEIAQQMFISDKTVSKHASNIFKKVECTSKEDFVIKFIKN
ncbi:MAG: helix-turn-helix transcriptional regulator [Crocinitomicaceae bacterium]|nr:helix-turn-helix transcriptional regulator [Crocinitomicaceae bacterium]